MLGDNKKISAGDNSTNIQAQSIVIHSGLSYTDAKEIALQTFKENFYILSEVAQATAIERAEQLVNAFLLKLEKEAPELISRIIEPDIQYTVINSQKHFARNGNIETLKMLSELLFKRFQASDNSLDSIVINEAIEVIPKIAQDQIVLLTSLFLTKYCKQNNVRTFIESQILIMKNYEETFRKGKMSFEHLVYAGVTRSDDTAYSSQPLEYYIKDIYKDELEEPLRVNNTKVYPLIREKFANDDESKTVFETWNNSKLSRYSLTSVGIAIAVSSYNLLRGASLNYSHWINS
jgi:hypothetical protein